jgi:hypothetical protein
VDVVPLVEPFDGSVPLSVGVDSKEIDTAACEVCRASLEMV